MKNGRVICPELKNLWIGSTVQYPHAGDVPFPVPVSTVTRITETTLIAEDNVERSWSSYILQPNEPTAAHEDYGVDEWRIINFPTDTDIPDMGVHFARAVNPEKFAEIKEKKELEKYKLPQLSGMIEATRQGANRARLFGTMVTYRLPNGILYVEKNYENTPPSYHEAWPYLVTLN